MTKQAAEQRNTLNMLADTIKKRQSIIMRVIMKKRNIMLTLRTDINILNDIQAKRQNCMLKAWKIILVEQRFLKPAQL